MTETRDVILSTALPAELAASADLPAVIQSAGPAATFAWEEFFSAHLRNPHTRAAYRNAVCRFLNSSSVKKVPVEKITPAMVGEYFDDFKRSFPTRKLHLAALRAFFDLLVRRHLMVLNPAASVRGERHEVIEGKTPEITADQTRRLIASIQTTMKVQDKPLDRPAQEQIVPLAIGLRDRAIIAMLLYTAARAGAIAKLQLKHFSHDGTQWTLRFEEKGGKSREIPVRHDLQVFLLAYLEAAVPHGAGRDTPFFRSAYRTRGRLTDNPMTGVDICRMMKRRLKQAGLPGRLSPHSFRVTTVTDLLAQGVPLEDVQYLAGHADPRTTRLYDRRQKKVTRNIVERISIQLTDIPG